MAAHNKNYQDKSRALSYPSIPSLLERAPTNRSMQSNISQHATARTVQRVFPTDSQGDAPFFRLLFPRLIFPFHFERRPHPEHWRHHRGHCARRRRGPRQPTLGSGGTRRHTIDPLHSTHEAVAVSAGRVWGCPRGTGRAAERSNKEKTNRNAPISTPARTALARAQTVRTDGFWRLFRVSRCPRERGGGEEIPNPGKRTMNSVGLACRPALLDGAGGVL